jgi:hypothetical protein
LGELLGGVIGDGLRSTIISAVTNPKRKVSPVIAPIATANPKQPAMIPADNAPIA